MVIPKILEKEIIDYCKANSIDDVNNFILKLIKQSFTIEKYGLMGQPTEEAKQLDTDMSKKMPQIVVTPELVEKLNAITNDVVNDTKKPKPKKIKEITKPNNDLYGEH